MADSLLGALALVLVLEGTLPLVAPGMWREAFQRLLAMSDGQLRFVGLLCVGCGLLGLSFLAHA